MVGAILASYPGHVEGEKCFSPPLQPRYGASYWTDTSSMNMNLWYIGLTWKLVWFGVWPWRLWLSCVYVCVREWILHNPMYPKQEWVIFNSILCQLLNCNGQEQDIFRHGGLPFLPLWTAEGFWSPSIGVSGGEGGRLNAAEGCEASTGELVWGRW